METLEPLPPQLLEASAAALHLPAELQREMEALFGRDFDHVRLHLGPQPERIHAEAFVCGPDIYISPAAYIPRTAAGRRLLIHELTHVVQQSNEPRAPRLAVPLLLNSPRLEAEALSIANGSRNSVSILPETAQPMVQCSTLRRDNKQALHGALEDLVKQVPITTAYKADTYTKSLLAWIREHPHVFTGEKYEFGGMKNQSAKIPVVIKAGQRISLSSLDGNDWKWIEKTILKLARKHRYGEHFTEVATRILDEDDNQWIAWKTSDCVFAAILIVLGLRFTGRGATVEGHELAVETNLAERLQVPKRVVQDHVLVHLLEDRLGWARMQVSDLETLNAKATTGRGYVVSYCDNPTTDFWHTVYGTYRGGGQWKWVDRQYERNYGNVRALLKGDLSAEANSWEIDANSPLVDLLRRDMDITTLKTTYKDFIAAL